MDNRRIPGLAGLPHPDHYRVLPEQQPAQLGVAQPPSKLKSHLTWGLVVFGSILLAIGVAVALHVALPISLAASLGICIGTTSFFGLIAWCIKGHKLGSSWDKYNIWQEALKKMPEEGSRSPALIQALQDVRDFLFDEGDANKLEGSYEHLEVLSTFAASSHDGVVGLSILEDKVKSWDESILGTKVDAFTKWMTWSKSGNDDITRDRRKKICRTVLSACLVGAGNADLKFTNEHLTPDGQLELPKKTCVAYCSLKQAMHRDDRQALDIDLSECDRFQGLTKEAKDVIADLPTPGEPIWISRNNVWCPTISTTITLPNQRSDDALESMADYVEEFSGLQYPVRVKASPSLNQEIAQILRHKRRLHNINLRDDFAENFANGAGWLERAENQHYKVHFLDGLSIELNVFELNVFDRQPLLKALSSINAIEGITEEQLRQLWSFQKQQLIDRGVAFYNLDHPGLNPDAQEYANALGKWKRENQVDNAAFDPDSIGASTSFRVPPHVNNLPPFFFAMAHVSELDLSQCDDPISVLCNIDRTGCLRKIKLPQDLNQDVDYRLIEDHLIELLARGIEIEGWRGLGWFDLKRAAIESGLEAWVRTSPVSQRLQRGGIKAAILHAYNNGEGKVDLSQVQSADCLPKQYIKWLAQERPHGVKIILGPAWTREEAQNLRQLLMPASNNNDDLECDNE